MKKFSEFYNIGQNPSYYMKVPIYTSVVSVFNAKKLLSFLLVEFNFHLPQCSFGLEISILNFLFEC